MAAILSAERVTVAPQRDEAHAGVLRFITAGSVDDGKSTLIGRLLHDSRQVLEDQLAAIERASSRRGMTAPDLSLLTDGLEAEREQGITIDVAYRYFATARCKFIIADTPGHVQYTRNMVTAASTADAAVILVDATRGLAEQTRRHLYITQLLGLRRAIVAVNKIDLVGYGADAFERVRADVAAFAAKLHGGGPRLDFVPVSALNGDMVVERGERLAWYTGPTLLELLESLEPGVDPAALPLRFPVQLVQRRPDGRAYLGRIASGTIAQAQHVVVLPARIATRIERIEGANGNVEIAGAGDSIALTLADEIDVARGDVIAEIEHAPKPARSFAATLVWLAAEPLRPGGRYLLKHASRTVKAKIALVSQEVDVATLEQRTPSGDIGMNSIVHAAIVTQQPLPVEPYHANRATGAFILIDEGTNQTVAAGMVALAC